MVIYQGRGRRLKTGALYHPNRNKQRHRFGRIPMETKIGEKRLKIISTRGGHTKVKAYAENMINVVDSKNKVTKRVKILRVDENKSSVDFKRRQIITKGAIVNTEEFGLVKVTSRPGQVGIVNGIKLE